MLGAIIIAVVILIAIPVSIMLTGAVVAAILGSSIVFLDGTVVNVALPAIREDLDTGLAAQQWIVEAYLLTLGALFPLGYLAYALAVVELGRDDGGALAETWVLSPLGLAAIAGLIGLAIALARPSEAR